MDTPTAPNATIVTTKMSPKTQDSNKKLSAYTHFIRADDDLHSSEITPSIICFHQAENHLEVPDADEFDEWNPTRQVHSRFTQGVTTRVERVLSKINEGYAITYASGLAASFAATTDVTRPSVSTNVFAMGTLPLIRIDDDSQPGDLCWLETPLNPTGEVKHHHAAGGWLLVDSTFGPPPVQYPLKQEADIVMHSGTKYFGGHSDLLCSILVTSILEKWKELWHIRTFSGNMMGSLDSWLLLRSLRTLHLRVLRQSDNAYDLAQWLSKAAGGKAYDSIPAGIIGKVWHSSLQGVGAWGFDPKTQLEGGWNATFSTLMTKEHYATVLPHTLRYFISATSLGGVESLVGQKVRSDPHEDPRLVRISACIEDVEASLLHTLRYLRVTRTVVKGLKEDLSKAPREIVKSTRTEFQM